MTNQERSSGFALNIIQEEIELSSQTAYVNDEVGGVPESGHVQRARSESRHVQRARSDESVYVQRSAPVPDTIKILLDCEEKGQKLFKQPSPSIYRVPSSLRDLNPSSFEPRVVSIGPLHKADELVQEFEEQKATYLHHLLSCLGLPPRQTLVACLQRVNAKIHTIRECYGGMKTNINDVELAKMMVMDACFIVEFIAPPSKKHPRLIYGNVILELSILRDLLLLENQIPFFVLQDIFDCTLAESSDSPLTILVFNRLQFLNPFKVNGYNLLLHRRPQHILGLLQKSFHPIGKNINSSTCPSSTMHNHTALELDKAGVKFKPDEDENLPLAITFSSSWFECSCWCWGNRTLKMPVMHIDDNSELFLRNIIAYEQCTPRVPNHVTSYACAIDMLVDTTEDLSRLIKSKVLKNDLGSNEDATNMINNISKEVVFAEFYYEEQWKQLDHYYNGCWPKNIARLKRKYFNSPWNAIALLGGLILFALTIIQTIYTMTAK